MIICQQGFCTGYPNRAIINEFLDVADNNVVIYNYVGDNSLVYSGYEYELVKSKLLNNIHKVTSLFELNRIKVNEDKFQCILSDKTDKSWKFNIGNYFIVPNDNVKILGLNVDSKLNFSTHISQICGKTGRQVHILCRLAHVLDQPIKMLVYTSFVECYFKFCLGHFYSKTNTYKIDLKIRKRLLVSKLLIS